jgi:hypothetical protein
LGAVLNWSYTVPSSCAGTGYSVEIIPKTDMDVSNTTGCNMASARIVPVIGNINKQVNMDGLKWNTTYCWRVSTVGATNNSTSPIYTFRTNVSPSYVQTRMRFYDNAGNITTTPKCTSGSTSCNQNTSATSTYIGGTACWISGNTTSPNSEKSINLEFEYSDPDTGNPNEAQEHRFAFIPISKINEETPLSDTVENSNNYSFFVNTQNLTSPPTQIFGDVPATHWAFYPINALYLNNISSGCSTTPLNYCPENTVSRAQIAVFLLKSKYGGGYTPPAATGTVFADVPITHPFASWIEQLVRDGITAGCGGGNYCPDQAVNRAQVAIFLIKAKYGSSYTPPTCTSSAFSDVAITDWFCPYVQKLYTDGFISGYSGTYLPNNNVKRSEMSSFLTKVFSINVPTNSNAQMVVTTKPGNTVQVELVKVAVTNNNQATIGYKLTFPPTFPLDKYNVYSLSRNRAFDILSNRYSPHLLGDIFTATTTPATDPNIVRYRKVGIINIDNQEPIISIQNNEITDSLGFSFKWDSTENNQSGMQSLVTQGVATEGDQFSIYTYKHNEVTYKTPIQKVITQTAVDNKILDDSNMSVVANVTSVPVGEFTKAPFITAAEWNFTTGPEGWGYPSPHATPLTYSSLLRTIGGYSSGNDPYFYSPSNLNINGDTNKIIKFGFSSYGYTGSDTVQVFFTTNTSTNWEEAKSKTISVTPSTGIKEYILDMSNVPKWTGTIQQIRFDPSSLTPDGRIIRRLMYQLKYMHIGYNPSWEFTSGTEGWGNANPAHMSNYTWATPGQIQGQVTNIDPILHSPSNLGLDITNNNTIKIRLQNQTASNFAQIVYRTNASPVFDATKSKTFTITPNSGYTEYTVDMSTATGWTGTLNQLRFDPADKNGTFAIDYIQIGNRLTTPSTIPLSARNTLFSENTVNTYFYFPASPPDSYMNYNRLKINLTGITDKACNVGEDSEHVFSVNESWTSAMQGSVVSDGSIIVEFPTNIPDSDKNIDIGTSQTIYKRIGSTIQNISTNFLASGVDLLTGTAKTLLNTSSSKQSIQGYVDINDVPRNTDIKPENWYEYFKKIIEIKEEKPITLTSQTWSNTNVATISDNKCNTAETCFINVVGNLTLENISCNSKAIFLIDGNLTIMNDFRNANVNSACLFIASGNILLDSNVNTKDETVDSGVAPYDMVEGYFIANGNITTNPDIDFDLNKGYMDGLIIRGGLIGDSVELNRDLGLRNNMQPAELIIYDSRYIYLLEDILNVKSINIRER